MRRNLVKILLHDALRNANELRIGTVVEQQVFAEILRVAAAIKAVAARGGIGRHHPLTHVKILDRGTDSDNVARQLMPKQSWGDDHARVVAPTKNFHVSATRQRRPDAD